MTKAFPKERAMKIQIKNRFSDTVLFECEIEADESVPYGVRLGMTVKTAISRGAVLIGADLSCADLSYADLRDADLSCADLSYADLSDANLSYANLSGVDLSGANLRGVDLSGANLRGVDLSGANLRCADLRYAVLIGADLSCADLSYADLRDADLSCADLSYGDLSDANLSYANLSGVDLSGAVEIPLIEHIHQRVYAAASAEGALDMRYWHADNNFCGTTHCRAGWVIHLAGDAGRKLETYHGPSVAAALIYQASDPGLEQVPNFYCSNEVALADMKRLAEIEAKREGSVQ